MNTPMKPKTRKQLLEENEYLRALCGICLKCHREKDAADFVRYEIWQDEDGFMAIAHHGGGSGGTGKTMKAAMKNAYSNMIRFLKGAGKSALAAKPWLGVPEKIKIKKRKVKR
jgi:hypothetical protein